jgi:hypothetical protein
MVTKYTIPDRDKSVHATETTINPIAGPNSGSRSFAMGPVVTTDGSTGD